MYKTAVPVRLATCERYGAEIYVERLRRMGAERVFLSVGSYRTDEKRRRETFDALRRYIPVFRQAGFEVGVWLWAFMVRGDRRYTHITSPGGAVSADQVCPSDDAFVRFAADYVAGIAACGPDLILYDDDFRLGFLDCGLGCTCENHRAHMSGLLGKEVAAEGLNERVFAGGKNEYRSAFLRANGHFLRRFAQAMRAAVDEVDPRIRLGLCACMDVWDFCGVAADELAVLLAGGTKPLLRLIGAPYWSVKESWGNRLQDVIELERMERAWCRDGIEIFSEGDVYPRPRFACPASRLECFDLALRASGETDGILKYVFDYSSSPAYEPGYVERHTENRALRGEIDRLFAGKTAVGLRVYEFEKKFETMTVPANCAGRDDVQNFFFSPAARLAAACAVPTVYRGRGAAGIAFGENARFLSEEEIGGGLLLDVRAAQILEERGVDVGLAQAGECFAPAEEYFDAPGEYVSLHGAEAVRIRVREGAVVESRFFADGDDRGIASYRYRNAAGQRFLVWAFDGYFAGDHALRSYARARQLREAVRLFGGDLPAFLDSCPDAYLLCREDENEKAVLIGNFSGDAVRDATLCVGPGYTAASFVNCGGRLCGDRVVIDCVAPFGCAAVAVRKAPA